MDAPAPQGRDSGSSGGDGGRFEERIKVAVRKRPLFKKEAERGDVDVLQADNAQSITVRAAAAGSNPPSVLMLLSRGARGGMRARGAPCWVLEPAGLWGCVVAGSGVVGLIWMDGGRQVLEPKTKVDLTRYTEEHDFFFDEVLGDECTNQQVCCGAGGSRGLGIRLWPKGVSW